MSAVNDNQNFLTGVLNDEGLTFNDKVYGLWVSVFKNVNHSSNGYSYPEPLVSDIMSVDYALTGKSFTAFNQEGKAPDVKFFITSGVKGSAFYNTNTIAADISDTFMSGESPVVVMSGLGYAGDVYRKHEVTGLVNSLVEDFQSLSVSGEDWVKTNISVGANLPEAEFADLGYSGYVNEVQTRYKFLYTDASNSVQQDLSIFDIPTQIEKGAALRYRISRKSDPLGSYITPQVTSDNKMIIDYSQYKDVVPVSVESNVNYDFESIETIRITQSDLEAIRDRDEKKEYNIASGPIGGLRVSKDEGSTNQFSFKILPLESKSFDDLYKIDFSIDRFKETAKENVTGYILTGITIAGDTNTVDLEISNKVYPRNIQSNDYDQEYLRQLVNESELEYSEEEAQKQNDLEGEDSDTSNLAKVLNERADLLNDLLNDDDTRPTPDNYGEFSKYDIDEEQENQSYSSNNSNGQVKFALPTLSLPKNTIDKGFYSNYLNSGEAYIATPLVEYSADPSFVYYGEQLGQLGYYIDNELRTTINSTAGGINIGVTGLCVGNSAIKSNARSENISFYNGRDLNIDTEGVIKKDNFTDRDKWENSINYFYAKNELYSFNVYPQNSDESNQKAFSHALGQAAAALPQGNGQFENANPRLFIEREVYVEDYDENQPQLVSESFKSKIDNTTDLELTTTPNEKLHSVQVYSEENSYQNYFVSSDYEEQVKFKAFIPYKDKDNNQNNFYENVNNQNSSNVLYSKAGNASVSDFQIARLEYVTGAEFSYQSLSNDYVVWHGTPANGNIIIDAYTEAEDIATNAYHLYGYNNQSDVLSFIKSNVTISTSNEVSVSSFSDFCVLKFPKKSFTKQEYYKAVDGNNYLAYNLSLLKNNSEFLEPEKAFFNIQIYDYKVARLQKNRFWLINKDNPYNNDSFGAENIYGNIIPRFFEDTSEDVKDLALKMFDYPNGPSSSKNYEGKLAENTPSLIQSLTDGVIKNKITVTEENEQLYSNSNDFLLDFNVGGKIIKGRNIDENVSRSFLDTKRLKITRVKYNIYSKDLVVLGDAGFPTSVELNTAWEYKLQYKLKTSNNWTELSSSTSLSNSDLQTTSEFINPFFYVSSDLSKQAYLSTVAFRTNMPRFLDDNLYEFRIFKYEKLVSPFDNVDIINKTNFLPINVSWTANDTAEYYNIYQVDTGNNQTLLETVPKSETASYSLPRVKQSYFDLGPANFDVGLGYYNILVSGVVPAVDTSDLSVDSAFSNFRIGDDDTNGQQYEINVTKNNSDYNNQYSAVSNISYSPIIDFRNNEAKQSAFTIDQKYDNYYFVTNSQNATLSDVNSDFEAYVINTGSSPCNLTHGGGVATIDNGEGVYINGSTISTITFTEASSFRVELDLNIDEQFIFLTSNATTSSTDQPLAVGQTVFVINDSDSSINFTFAQHGPTTKTIAANQTKSFTTPDGSSITNQQTYSNINQNLTTLETSSRTVNLNFSNLTVTNNVEDLPVYNFARNPLSINGSASLPAKTLGLVTKAGSSISTTEISSFDYTKIYFNGSEDEALSNYIIVDDTDIIISQFNSGDERDYYFILSPSVSRDLNIRIINGNSIKKIPIEYKSFKITVYKVSGVVRHELFLPQDNLQFDLSGDIEQMVVVKEKPIEVAGSTNADINLSQASNKIKTNSFVYVSNKSATELLVANPKVSISRNQTYRIYLNTENEIETVAVPKSRLGFDFTKDADFSSSTNINLFNLRFNNADLIAKGAALSNKNSFLILKNVFSSNEIKTGTQTLNESNVYRLEGTDAEPKASIPKFSQSPADVFKNIYDSEEGEEEGENKFIYIDNSDLKNITIRDSFDRQKSRKGFVITKEKTDLSAYSFDDIYEFDLNSSQVFTYEYDQGPTPDGSLSVKNKKVDFNILNENSLGGAISVDGQTLIAGAFFVNLTLTEVTLSGSNKIYKNRIADHSFNVYPLFNKEEFFIAKRSVADTFYYDVKYDYDVDKIIWDPTSSSTSIVRNFSSKVVTLVNIKTNDENTINPNKQATITTSVATDQAIVSVGSNVLEVLYSNQADEIQLDYPINNKQLTTSDFFRDNSGLNEKSIYSVNLNSPQVGGVDGWHCFGLSSDKNNVLQGNIFNDLYLTVYTDEGELNYGKVKYEGNASFVNFNRLKRVNFDLGKIFKNDDSFTGDVEIIPFYRELVTYSLPNTSSISDGKKIIFVNLVKCNTNADNKIFDGSSETAVRNLNAVEIFTKSGSNWSRETGAGNIPAVQNLHASLTGVAGLGFSPSSVNKDGKELVEINNVDTLRVTLESFEKGEFGTFYLYNSSGLDYINLIIANKNPFKYAIGTFSKLDFDGGSYRVRPILYSKRNRFFDIDAIKENLNDEDGKWVETYASLPLGTTFKIRQSLRKKVLSTGEPADAEVLQIANLGTDNQMTGSSIPTSLLRVDQLILNSDRFFVYGSSVRNELGDSMDSYMLQLEGDIEAPSSFFVFNNTNNNLIVNLKGGFLTIPAFNMYEITEGYMYPFEVRRKNEYFISDNQSSISNFLIKSKLDVKKSSLPTYSLNEKDSSKNFSAVEKTDYKNTLVTVNVPNVESVPFSIFAYKDNIISKSKVPVTNQVGYNFIDFKNFNTVANTTLEGQRLLSKPVYHVPSAGHYIMNNTQASFNIESLTSNDYFLINNTVKDINVRVGAASKTLYRNTVLVLSSNKEDRYIKKAKNEDEFYAIFNPKTKISTQREIANVLKLETYSEVAEVYNADFIKQDSFLTLYSKAGQTETFYLNLNQYYKGVDIPTSTVANATAYEVGIGHETIYKFKFIDPSSNLYTLPGISKNETYKVEANDDLLLNQSIGLLGSPPLRGQVKYMGKVLGNGDTFTGEASPWYEVNYPDYVKVYKVIEEFPKGYSNETWENSIGEEYNGLTEEDVEGAEDGEVVNDSSALFKEKIKNDLAALLTEEGDPETTIAWIPENETAFWLDDSTNENRWEVELIKSERKELKLNDDNKLSFVKCTMKNESLRSPVSNFSYSYYSALQNKVFLSKSKDLTIGFDYNLTPNQKRKLKNSVLAEYNKADSINSSGKNYKIAFIDINSILPDPSTYPNLEESKVEISIRISKINQMPELRLEDYSQNGIIKLLNNQP